MNPITYERAGTVGDAIRAHARRPDSKFLGGGTNLVDLMKYGVEQPLHLIDITHLPLTRIEELPGGGLRIGALVRNSDVASDERVAQRFPAVSQSLLSGASPQLRNMATTGGNLLQRTRCYYFFDTAFPCNKRQPGSGCSALGGVNRIHAVLGQSDACIAVHPSDFAVALAALDAVVQVDGPQGRRAIPLVDFHRLPGNTPHIDTNLGRDELIVAVDLPASTLARRSYYLKVRDREQYAFALTSAAVALDVQAGTVRAARIALGGVAHKPWRVEAADAEMPRGARAVATRLLDGARPTRENTFKLTLVERTLGAALMEAKG
jgi:xanthine dehydrogenase YagS FAD-binding subunit